jgi:hypothetical protein
MKNAMTIYGPTDTTHPSFRPLAQLIAGSFFLQEKPWQTGIKGLPLLLSQTNVPKSSFSSYSIPLARNDLIIRLSQSMRDRDENLTRSERYELLGRGCLRAAVVA